MMVAKAFIMLLFVLFFAALLAWRPVFVVPRGAIGWQDLMAVYDALLCVSTLID